MLTNEQIEKALSQWNPSDDFAMGFKVCATWANETLSAQISELQAAVEYQAAVLVDLRNENAELQTRRREHLRTISDVMGEKAGLLNLLRENLETTPAAMDYIKVRLKTKKTLEKHGVK